MKERFKVIPAVYLVFEREKKVLLLKRANTGYMDGFFSLPAGHIDGKEPAIDAAIREAKEEVGIDLNHKALRLLHTMHRQVDEDDRYGHERIDLFFGVNNWVGEPQNLEPHKCSELGWYSLDNLPKKMAPEVVSALDKIAANEIYSDLNF